MLYGDLSGIRRAGLIGLVIIVSLVSLGKHFFVMFEDLETPIYLLNLVTGFIMIFAASGVGMTIERRSGLLFPTMPMFAIITVLGNISFTTLIGVRLFNHQRDVSKALGKAYGSLYTRIITICVESCALITIVYLAFLLFWILLLKFQSPPGHLVHASVCFPSPSFFFPINLNDTSVLTGDFADAHHQTGGAR